MNRGTLIQNTIHVYFSYILHTLLWSSKTQPTKRVSLSRGKFLGAEIGIVGNREIMKLWKKALLLNYSRSHGFSSNLANCLLAWYNTNQSWLSYNFEEVRRFDPIWASLKKSEIQLLAWMLRLIFHKQNQAVKLEISRAVVAQN